MPLNQYTQSNSTERVPNGGRNFDESKGGKREKWREGMIAFQKFLQEKYPNKQFPDLGNIKSVDKKSRTIFFEKHKEEIKKALSLEERVLLVEEASGDLDINTRFSISDLLLSFDEKKTWIQSEIKNNKDGTVLKAKIKSFFKVHEIVAALGYEWGELNSPTRKFFATKARIEGYRGGADDNEKIRDWLLNMVLGLKDVYQDVKVDLDSDHTTRLNKYLTKHDNKSNYLKEAFRDIPKNMSDEINKLPEDMFIELLDKLCENAIKKKNAIEKGALGGVKGVDIVSYVVVVFDELEVHNKEVSRSIKMINRNNDKPTQTIDDYNKQFKEFVENKKIDLKTLPSDEKLLLEKQFYDLFIKKSNLTEEQKKELQEENISSAARVYAAAIDAGYADVYENILSESFFQQIEAEYIISQKSSTLERKVEVASHNTENRNEFREKIKNNSSLGGDIVPTIQAFEDLKEENQSLLLDETNDQIKSFFVDRVLLFIQDSLNISIDEQNKENILSQFDLEDGLKFENQEISFQGYAHGQLLELKYNMQTGELFHKPFMSSQGTDQEGNSAINFNSDYQILANGPSLKSISYIANDDIDYSDLLEQSTEKESESNSLNMQKYSNLLFEQLDHRFPQKFVENKDLLKETYLQSILAQEMIDLAGITEIHASVGKSTPIEHEFFKIIYQNTYHLNIDKKTEHLQRIRNLIARLRNTYEQGKNKLEKQADGAGDFEVNSKNLLHKLFDKRALDKKNFLSQETNPQRQKMKIWTDFLDNMSSRKKDKSMLNPVYLRDFARGAEKPSSENQFSKSVVESMSSYLGDDLDRSLDKQLSEII